MKTKTVSEHTREQTGLLATLEKRVLIWLVLFTTIFCNPFRIDF